MQNQEEKNQNKKKSSLAARKINTHLVIVLWLRFSDVFTLQIYSPFGLTFDESNVLDISYFILAICILLPVTPRKKFTLSNNVFLGVLQVQVSERAH